MGDQLETRYAQIIAAVVCNQRSIVEQRRGGDPGVGRLDPASGGLRGDHHLGPLAAKVGAGRHDGESLDIEAQPMDALGTPAVLKRPPLDFGHGHERDASSTPGQIRAIELSRSEEHTSELQSLRHLVCRLLLEKKKKTTTTTRCLPTLCRSTDHACWAT